MALPLTVAERLAVLESRSQRDRAQIGLAQDGLALLSEDARALRSELAEFRAEVTARLDRHEVILTALASHFGIEIPSAAE